MPGRLSFQTGGTGGGSPTERLRIKNDGQLLHTRSDDTTRYDLEFRQTGGITDGNYGGIHWTQGSTGSTNLGAIEIEYASTGQPDIVFKTRQSSGTAMSESLRIASEGYVNMPHQVRFCAYAGAAQTGGTAYKIEFSSTSVNIGTNYSVSNDRFTAPVAGDYYFMYRVMAGASTFLRCQFKVNGSYVLDQFFSENVTYANNVGAMVYTLAVGDYVEVWCDVQSNSQGTIHGGYRCFIGHLLG